MRWWNHASAATRSSVSGCWSVCSTITSGSRCLWDRTYAKRWERRSAPNDWLQTSTPRYFGKLSGVSGLFTIFEKTRDSGTHTFYALRRGSGRIIAGIYEKTPRRAVVQHGDRQLDFAEIQRTGDGYDRPPQKNHLLSASILSRVQEEIQVRKAALVGHREGGTRAAFCSGMYCKGVKRHAKYACRIGGEMDECGRNAEKAAEHRLERARADVLFLQINRLRASRSKMRQDGCR